MTFPTHVDPVSRHIRIHRDESCGYVRRRRNEKHATWFQDFDIVGAAEEFTQGKGYKTQFCKRCVGSSWQYGPRVSGGAYLKPAK